MRVAIAGVLCCLLWAGACRHVPSAEPEENAEGCVYAGKPYAEGESFPDADGCNTCFCEANGGVACTLALCLDPAAQVCSYGGRRYTIGASFPAADGCNTCFCPPSGHVGCTQKECNEEHASLN
ncbi:MAG TPA: hypothetical protein VJR89_17780 [Polyangiales bacterium]|nr:hypothetical protein [Polyangiales bacterium]